MRRANPSRYGLIEFRNESFPKIPMEVPKTTKRAGPIQQGFASKDTIMVPMLAIFSFFI
jgi:hypothetical protein